MEFHEWKFFIFLTVILNKYGNFLFNEFVFALRWILVLFTVTSRMVCHWNLGFYGWKSFISMHSFLRYGYWGVATLKSEFLNSTLWYCQKRQVTVLSKKVLCLIIGSVNVSANIRENLRIDKTIHRGTFRVFKIQPHVKSCNSCPSLYNIIYIRSRQRT